MKDQDKSKEQLIWELKKVRQQVSLENQRKEQEVSRINQILQTANATLDLDEVVEKVMDALKLIFSFNQISIYLFNAQTNRLEVTNWYGDGVCEVLKARFESYPLSIDWEEVYFIKAFLDNEPFCISPITPKIMQYYSERDRQMFEWNPHHSIATYPLQVQDKVIGIINFVATKTPFTLSEGDFRRVQHYVAQIATTINNAYLVRKTRFALKETQAREREIAHINRVIQMTNATLDFDEVFKAILDGLREIFEFDAIGIQLADEERHLLNIYKVYGDFIKESHIAAWRSIHISSTGKDSISSYVFSTGELAYFPAITPDLPFDAIDRQIYDILPFISYLAYPLSVQNKTIGVISFFCTKNTLALEDSDLAKIERYVTSVSTAINNAKTHEQLKYTNEIFSFLLEASAAMQRKSEISDIFQFTLEQLRYLFPSLGFGLILHGERPEIITYGAFTGITEQEQRILSENPAKLLHPKAETDIATWMIPAGLTDDAQNQAAASNWFLFPMDGSSHKVVGNLIVKGPVLTAQARTIITLFLEHVTNVAENKLLAH